MAKGKSTSSGPHKEHGPKKHMHRWTGAMKWSLAKSGILKKEHDYESFQMACQARGKRSISETDFKLYRDMKQEDQKTYFSNIKK